MTWIFKNEEGQLKKAALSLSREMGIGHLAATVCVNRGMTTENLVQAFLNPKLDQLTHPFKILDLEKAVDHLLSLQQLSYQPSQENLSETSVPHHSERHSGALTPMLVSGSHPPKASKKIRVFTDYDVDGTTGAALLTWFFRDLKFNFDVVQPDRFKDGYGLNPGAVEDAARDRIDTLITVDCGITNFEAAEKAKELGVKLIIIDHHLIDPVKGVPKAFAVIDPQRADCESNLKQLCGCGLAFYLSMGLRIKAREQGYFKKMNVPEPNLKSLLDLVVLATAADMVPLTGDNRILVKHGLEILRETQKPGLRAMMANAGIEVKTVSPMSLGFSLGPRINASGRMGSAETAYRCLTTKDVAEAQKLADELEGINKSRADLQNLIWDEVRAEVTRGIDAGKFSHAVVVSSPNWHEGVVGIVASKVTEHFKKPAVILAIREDGIAKGSVRSYGGYNVLEALHLSKSFLKGYGGHKFAAGLSLAPEQIEAFAEHYNLMMQSLAPTKKSDDLQIEGRCTLADFTPQALGQLEKLAPFGPGNPEPLFSLHAQVATQNILKGRHVKLKLCETGSKQVIEGIWFNAAERLESTQLMEKCAHSKITCAFAGIPELNRFLGRTTPTLRIKAATEVQ